MNEDKELEYIEKDALFHPIRNDVFDDRELSDRSKLLFGYINGFTRVTKKRIEDKERQFYYCQPSNEHLALKLNCDVCTISRELKKLKDKNYIYMIYNQRTDSKTKRKIFTNKSYFEYYLKYKESNEFTDYKSLRDDDKRLKDNKSLNNNNNDLEKKEDVSIDGTSNRPIDDTSNRPIDGTSNRPIDDTSNSLLTTPSIIIDKCKREELREKKSAPASVLDKSQEKDKSDNLTFDFFTGRLCSAFNRLTNQVISNYAELPGLRTEPKREMLRRAYETRKYDVDDCIKYAMQIAQTVTDKKWFKFLDNLVFYLGKGAGNSIKRYVSKDEEKDLEDRRFDALVKKRLAEKEAEKKIAEEMTLEAQKLGFTLEQYKEMCENFSSETFRQMRGVL